MKGTLDRISADFRDVLATEPFDLVRASLVFARLEYPDLSPHAAMAELDRLGRAASSAVAPLARATASERIAAVSRLLYDQTGFSGNRTHYDDFRNSLLNVVLDRRIGIPITLALVYIETARRAGVEVRGISFPGHFLLRAADDDEEGRPIVGQVWTCASRRGRAR
jgi:regulator of sirC expression with transglutaminase-like and TPR domain